MVEPPDLKKPKLNGDELGHFKKRFGDSQRKIILIPRLSLLSAGENASIIINARDKDRRPLFLRDVQYLLMFSIIGQNAPQLCDKGWKPWFKLDKSNKLSHTVVLVVEGLTIDHYLAHKTSFSNLNSKFYHKLELITSPVFGGSIAEQLAVVPLSATQKYNLIKEFGSLEAAASNSKDLIRLLEKIFPVQEGMNNVIR